MNVARRHHRAAKAEPVVTPRGRAEHLTRPAAREIAFGSSSAIVTSLGLVVGFGAAAVSRAALVSGLLIIGLADNISDSLSIHIYQESENREVFAATKATLTNFLARLIIAITFVGLVLLSPPSIVVAISVAWGVLLLGALTYGVARIRRVNPWPEMIKHLIVALIVIGVSRELGGWIASHVG